MEKLFPLFVKTNLDLIKDVVVTQIEDTSVQLLLTSVLGKISESAFLLSDDNPDNKAQLKLLWLTLSSDQDVARAFEQLFITAIQKVKDPKVREGLLLITPEVVKTLVAVSDTNVQDGEQIEKIWKDFIKSPAFLDFVLSNIVWLLDKVNLPTWLQEFIKRYIKL